MAQQNVPASQKKCATCGYWSGERTTPQARDRSLIASLTGKAKCVGGGHNRADTQAIFTCGKWMKWPLLK